MKMICIDLFVNLLASLTIVQAVKLPIPKNWRGKKRIEVLLVHLMNQWILFFTFWRCQYNWKKRDGEGESTIDKSKNEFDRAFYLHASKKKMTPCVFTSENLEINPYDMTHIHIASSASKCQ